MTWFLPIALGLALSIRTPNLPDLPFDYEVSAESQWTGLNASVAYEREDGAYYLNYSAEFDRGLLYGLNFTCRTQIKEAHDIDRQSAIVGRKWTLFGIGAGAVAEKYSKPRGAVDFWVPLPNGGLTFTTDFNQIHLWDGTIRYDFLESGRVIPYILGVFLSDNGTRWYQGKVGVEIKLGANDVR